MSQAYLEHNQMSMVEPFLPKQLTTFSRELFFQKKLRCMYHLGSL